MGVKSQSLRMSGQFFHARARERKRNANVAIPSYVRSILSEKKVKNTKPAVLSRNPFVCQVNSFDVIEKLLDAIAVSRNPFVCQVNSFEDRTGFYCAHGMRVAIPSYVRSILSHDA